MRLENGGGGEKELVGLSSDDVVNAPTTQTKK